MPAANKEAAAFAKKWQDKGDEKQDSQNFWRELLSRVFGIHDPESRLSFEKRVSLKNTSFIDVYIPETKVIIEQKSLGIDLEKAKKQSDGTELTPFGQAKRYNDELPYSEKARWIVTCNFERFLIYDLEKPREAPTEILLKNMAKDYHLLEFLVKFKDEALIREEELSVKAGEIVGTIYDALLKEYGDSPSVSDLKSLNKLCVRLVFCLYAEDSGLFGDSGDAFCKYLENYRAGDLRQAIISLFKVLDTPDSKRSKFLSPEQAAFPYVNGSLFAVDEDSENIPNFSDELRDILIKKAGESFDWSGISPTIFGAVFESTLNPETRRSGGMHYTSIENIHKVIDPLFLNDLRNEFRSIQALKPGKNKRLKLEEFQKKIASLTFMDPACGSGNFLTETYLSLRKLENMILKELYQGIGFLGEDFVVNSPIQVSIGQFYGIEINDFAVSVAKTALWIAESQTIMETEQIINSHIDFFPLKSYSNIAEANALRIDWNSVIPKERLNFIMGNPPFLGYTNQNTEQKSDMLAIISDEEVKNYDTTRKIDYVAGWYMKAAQYMQNTPIHAAFVSTNSITQGEQVAFIWKPLIEHFSLSILFAWKSFIWDSEASEKAHVHCVIVGFSCDNSNDRRFIYDKSGPKEVKEISPYLIASRNVFIQNRTSPISDVSKIITGNRPIDGSYLLLSEEEYQDVILHHPEAVPFIRPFTMGREFLHNLPRYCIWLKDVSPAQYTKSKFIMERIKLVKEMRLNSKRPATKKLAQSPMLFGEIRQPEGNYLGLPEVSSEKRQYIPIGYLSSDVIAGNKLLVIPNASIYDFGILTSVIHNAWMRTVAGRLKSDYNYSNTVVYNNFVWVKPSDKLKTRIEKTAQAILDARKIYPDSSLADLYDELSMPPELRKAHQENDRAVLELYGLPRDASEEDIVTRMFELYEAKTSGKNNTGLELL